MFPLSQSTLKNSQEEGKEESGNEVWGSDITLVFPRILFIAIPLPLDEELEVVCLHLVIQHLLNLLSCQDPCPIAKIPIQLLRSPSNC